MNRPTARAIRMWVWHALAMGAHVVFITEDDDYDQSRIPFLVAPAYQMMSRELVANGAKILSGEVKLPPGGVLVWRE